MILYQDSDWLAVNKPTGLATHAGNPGELGAVEWLDLHLGIKTHVISRLDRGTSGVLLLALNPAASARAQEIHESGAARKVYEFWSHQDIPAPDLNRTWVRDEPIDGKPARTEFTRIGSSPNGRFCFQAEITRGRRHQVRQHAAASGVPILGDTEYDGLAENRLFLHCREVLWPGIDQTITTPVPVSYRAMRTGRDTGFPVCLDRRGRWLDQVTNASRVVHRDEIPGLPVAIDVYGEWFNAVWFDEETTAEDQAQLLHPVLRRLMTARNCRGGVVRTHRKNPHQKGLVTEITEVGEPVPELIQVHEHGLDYEINLKATQHPGLFLDQRDSRRRVALAARDKRLANLFAFTCSFSLVAAAAECEVAFSIDTARPCLSTGKWNFELNGLTSSGRGKFIQEDARKWLRRQLRRKQEKPDEFVPLDLVVCDPPVFASSKDGGQFSVEKEWPDLAAAAAGILAPDGAALFANNHRSGDHAFYRKELEKFFGGVVDLRPPLDFPVLPGALHHMRSFWCLPHS